LVRPLASPACAQCCRAATLCGRPLQEEPPPPQRPGLTAGGAARDVDGGPDVNCMHWFMKTTFRFLALLGDSTRAALESGLQFILRYSLSYPLQCFWLIVLGHVVCYFFVHVGKVI
jgi:hypothetical protein